MRMKKLLITVACLMFPAAAWAGNTCTTTATGVNASSASHWTCTPSGTVPGNGDCTVINNATLIDVNTIWGPNVPSTINGGSACPAITMNAPLTVGTGNTLTVRGDVQQNGTSFTMDCSSTTILDSSLGGGFHPLWSQTGHGTDSLNSASGCTSSTYWTLTSNLSSGGASFNIVGNSNGGGLINLSYGSWTNCGQASVFCFNPVAFFASGITFNHVLFATPSGGAGNDGEFYFPSLGGGVNIDIEESSWIGSVGSNNLYIVVNAPTATGTRVFQNNVFDVGPNLGFNDNWGSANIHGNYLDEGWSSQFAPDFDGNFVREGNSPYGPLVSAGNTNNNYWLEDYFPAPTVTSTATSATSSTLVDTSQSWPPGQFANVPLNGWSVLIIGGTGINQIRGIGNNTANTLDIDPNWIVTPDATSTYEIIDGLGGAHYLLTYSGTHTGEIADCTFSQAGGEGHFYTTPDITGNITLTNAIVLPDATGLNGCGNLSNMGATCTGPQYTESLTHNTVYVASMSALSVGDYNSCTGMISLFENNLTWTSAGAFSGSIGNHKINDSGFPVSGGGLNYILPANADYNSSWNGAAGNYLDNGYNLNLSAMAGPHDVILTGVPLSTGPNFVNPTNWINWCKSLGVAGTLITTVSANCRAAMMSVNNFTGAQTAFTPAAALSYVTAGFAPQNSALHAASDGSWIGAVPGGSSPSPPSNGSTAAFWWQN
jgi:hypothetical protein